MQESIIYNKHINVDVSAVDQEFSRGVYLCPETTEGNIKVTLSGEDKTDVNKAIVQFYYKGMVRPVQVIKIWNADTTATGIVAYYWG